MDVSGWTMADRLILPDWCFANRELAGLYIANGVPGTTLWGIGTLDLPHPACIWQLVINVMPSGGGTGYLRIGLRDAIPVNVAQMDAAIEIFPHAWRPHAGPNVIPLFSTVAVNLVYYTREVVASENNKIVVELECVAGAIRCDVAMVVSGLPTNVSNVFNHKIA